MESVTADAPVNIAVVKYCEYRAVLSIDHWLCGRLGDKPFGWHASDFWATRRLRLQEWLREREFIFHIAKTLNKYTTEMQN